jgi:hypothetical protein
MVYLDCANCQSFPCMCHAPVTVRCSCGGWLTATDTLEDKRRAHVEHVTTLGHRLYAARFRAGIASPPRCCAGSPGPT